MSVGVREILDKLHQAASSPKAQKERYLAQGKKVVLTAPVYTPEEIIHSMGCVPMGAWGADVQLKESKRYFPAFICSIMQSIVELGIRGDYEGCSAIVIPSLCDSLKVLGQNFKYAVPSIPFIPMTYPQNRLPEYGAAYTLDGYKRVIADLERATGETFSEEKLAASIEVYNRHNAAMRALDAEMARHGEITAQERSDVFRSAFFMEKGEHTALAEALTEALKAQPAEDTGVPILVSGILADSPSLNAIIQKAGLRIVADDVAAQSRQYRTDAPAGGAPLDRLVKKFQNTGCCSVLYDPEKKRVEYIVSLAKERGAKGVVVALTKFCDPEEFDYPLIKRACEAAGLAVTMIEIDRQMTDYAQAETALEAFQELLN